MPRPEHIPEKIWDIAKGGSRRFAPDEDIQYIAEIMISRAEGKPDPINEDRIVWQPFLTYRQTRVIRDALVEHETVADEDVACLQKLQEQFSNEIR